MNRLIYALTSLFMVISSCSKNESSEQSYFDQWTNIGDGLNSNVPKKVLTEFVGSTNCPGCATQEPILNSYFNESDENYVGDEITSNWFVINYHTYHPSMWDPMYLTLRGESAEEDFCYVRFGDGYGTGNWYNIGGVPTVYTNGSNSSIYQAMANEFLTQSTPVQIDLQGTIIDERDVTVQISINSSMDMSNSDSLYLFIAATIDEVNYTGYNGLDHHDNVFLGWITSGLEGELLSIKNEEIAKTYYWSMDVNWPENTYESSWSEVEYDVSNLSIIAFIQNKYSKEVIQVARSN